MYVTAVPLDFVGSLPRRKSRCKNYCIFLLTVWHTAFSVASMPNKRAANKRQFGMVLDKDIVERIDEYCRKNGITRVEFFRRAAEARLKQSNKDKTK